jgi:hypothetical protein
MKFINISLLALLSSCALGQAPKKDQEVATKKEYVSEAPLPEGWPTPGPYDEVVEKKYPAYRAAYTPSTLDGIAFWTLFSHIKRKDIPMTAPVEKSMSMEPKMKMSAMGFLYQNGEVGSVGKDGSKVEVKDMASTKVLTYAWMGDDNDDNVAKAKKAIDEALKAQGKEAVQYRMMGYNGPQTPRKNKTWELHAVLK